MNEDRFLCVAAAGFGLESVVRAELQALGIPGERVEDGRVFFRGSASEIARCNIGLRAADRVLIQLAEFPAVDFDAFYEGVRGIPWRDLLAPSPRVTVDARSVKSRLTAVPSLQSVAKKAIINTLRGGSTGAGPRMEETGPAYDVEIIVRADHASVCLDTTGPGLHKRGYRQETGEAPLRENLAASLVLLSRWEPSRPFADPLCGSGTIPIEAALLAARIAPGLSRAFAAESWPLFPPSTWKQERESARASILRGVQTQMQASDRDAGLVRIAEANARRAGVAEMIRFRAARVEAFTPEGEYGCMVCNPPYGERQGQKHEVEALYRAMGMLYRSIPTWSLFALTAEEQFQKFFGARASRNRKLYNGNIRCWYFQFFGPLPRR